MKVFWAEMEKNTGFGIRRLTKSLFDFEEVTSSHRAIIYLRI